MDKLNTAQNINIAATLTNNIDTICSEGNKLYSFLENNINEITRNKRSGFHIGSAMYFYKNYIDKEKDSIKYKLVTLIAYVNLYESLAFRDIQSVIGAYRLHMLLVDEKQFFRDRLRLQWSLDELLNMDADVLSATISTLIYSIQYALFAYCRQTSYGWTALSTTERKKFERIYHQFKGNAKTYDFNDDSIFKTGFDMLNYLYKFICENDLQYYETLGVLT